MKALITGIDFSNFGSLAMLAVVTRYFGGETVKITHVNPKCLGAMVKGDNVIVIRIRDYFKLLFTPVQLDRFLLTASQRNLRTHFQSADILFDISGFALSSQFSLLTTVRFLSPLFLGARHELGMILMPQSCGPFDYHFKFFVMRFIKAALRKVRVLYARDESSLQYLSAEDITAKRCDDLVFLYDQGEAPDGVSLEVNKSYVGVVPNCHLLRLCSRKDLIQVYHQALRHLIKKGFVPVLLPHTLKADLELLSDIVAALNKTQTVTSDKYVYIDCPLSLSNLFYLYSRFEFIIASRFHSIVMNLANRKPAVIIGWADKYNQLSKEFGQQAYVAEVDARSIIKAIDRLIKHRDAEAKKITDILHRKQKNCASIIKQHLRLLHQSPFFDEHLSYHG